MNRFYLIIRSLRNDREALSMIPQQHGCLNKNYQDHANRYGKAEVEISWGPIPKQRIVGN